jgi:uncharacterized protein YfdQ (DUF2303 family)
MEHVKQIFEQLEQDIRGAFDKEEILTYVQKAKEKVWNEFVFVDANLQTALLILGDYQKRERYKGDT